jgi:hypothetical protein
MQQPSEKRQTMQIGGKEVAHVEFYKYRDDNHEHHKIDVRAIAPNGSVVAQATGVRKNELDKVLGPEVAYGINTRHDSMGKFYPQEMPKPEWLLRQSASPEVTQANQREQLLDVLKASLRAGGVPAEAQEKVLAAANERMAGMQARGEPLPGVRVNDHLAPSHRQQPMPMPQRTDQQQHQRVRR